MGWLSALSKNVIFIVPDGDKLGAASQIGSYDRTDRNQ
jgi:hypothetical protein